MNKRNLLNLGLLIFIAVLVLLTVYEPGIEPPTPTPTLLKLDKEAITRIAISRENQPDVELVKNDKGEWWMEKPLHYPAETFRIDSLLRITELKSLSSFAAEKEKLATFQLDKPQATLTLNGNTTLAFGGSTPLDHRRYVMEAGRVHLTTDSYYYYLIGKFPIFLRKQLLDNGSVIEALTLPGLSVTQQEGHWQLVPEPGSFSADQVTQLIDNWKHASALEVKPYGGADGEKITLTLKGQEQPLELLLTAREPDLVFARPELGLEFHFDAASASELLQLPALEKPPAEKSDQVEADKDEQDEKDAAEPAH